MGRAPGWVGTHHLSIPLNGFEEETATAPIPLIKMVLSIPLNGFPAEPELPEPQTITVTPFNSIEWIPGLAWLLVGAEELYLSIPLNGFLDPQKLMYPRL